LQQQDNQRQELIAGDQQALVQSEMQRPAAVPAGTRYTRTSGRRHAE
jgi:hypothetical protein